ncbi:DEAD/DEAH box helicase [Sphaerisporangium rufum]|nr:DEAD/DEAH box helicase [Sphaerisporangium rufum]
MALPLAISGQDVIGQARTGTGKTYAFGVAMLQRVGKPRKNRKKPRGLVVVPTRELALQVTEDLVVAGGKLGSRILTVYGGRAYEPQIEALKQGVDVIVGTPGRLLDLVKQKHLDLGQVSMLVLDEADRMLDLGFLPDIERIIKLIPAERQTMLFSATLPGEIVALSRRYLARPTHVRAENPDAGGDDVSKTVQFVWRTHRMDKIEIVGRMLQCEGRGLTMVFCETKRACDMVSEQLKERGFAAAAVHGDLGQGQREQALRAFRNGKIDVLVATDVAARGIDVDDVTHVVNYDCPQDEKAYVHRIGRTGRAGRTGVAVTFVEWEDLARWKVINNALGLDFADPVETYSTSPHIYAELGIPAGTKGVLPRAQRSRAGLAAEEIEDLGETGRIRSRRDRDDRPGGRDRDDRRDRDREDRAERRERPSRDRSRRRTRGGRSVEHAEQPAAVPALAPGGDVLAPEATVPAAERAVPPAERALVEQAPAERAPVAQAPIERAPAAQAPAERAPVAQAPAERAPAQQAPAAGRRARRGADTSAISDALSGVTPAPAEHGGASAPHAQEALIDAEEFAPVNRPARRTEPERIVPASPFAIVFVSPDLATTDDDVAPSAASERGRGRKSGGQRPRRS